MILATAQSTVFTTKPYTIASKKHSINIVLCHSILKNWQVSPAGGEQRRPVRNAGACRVRFLVYSYLLCIILKIKHKNSYSFSMPISDIFCIFSYYTFAMRWPPTSVPIRTGLFYAVRPAQIRGMGLLDHYF